MYHKRYIKKEKYRNIEINELKKMQIFDNQKTVLKYKLMK